MNRMRRARSGLGLIALLGITGCGTVTECDCIAVTVVVFGRVTGASSGVSVDLSFEPGACNGGTAPSSIWRGTAQVKDGAYEAGSDITLTGPVCLIATAETRLAPVVSVTRRVDVTLSPTGSGDPQRLRVDFDMSTP